MRKNLIAMSVATLVAGLGMAGGAAAAVILDNGAATISPSNATFQTVQTGGIGHQLVIPYFNSQLGNATLFQLVNTDGVNGKAVKVRFRGASNSDDLFDFQVYLSPNDVWTANVSQDAATGLSVLTTNDRSCTIPAVNGQVFVTSRLPQDVNGWTAAERAEQTREGYIEIFNMADIPPFSPVIATGAVSATVNPLYTAIKHVGNPATPPCSGVAITNLANEPTTTPEAYALGFRAPTGTLFANWTIINVPKGGAATGEATALTAQATTADPNNPAPATIAINANGNIVFFPQLSTPVGAARVNLFTADPSLRTIPGTGVAGAQDGVTIGNLTNTSYTTVANPTGGGTRTLPIYTALLFDLPDFSTPYLSSELVGGAPTTFSPLVHAEQLTRALAATQVINEYLTATEIAANTDWVLSQPTRRYSVALDYRGSLKSGATVTAAPTAAYSRFAFRDYYMSATAPGTGGNVDVIGFQICVRPVPATGPQAGLQTLQYWDREENTPAGPGPQFVISPGTPAPVTVFRLCGETSLLLWNAPAGASVLGGTVAVANVTTAFGGLPYRDGWARLQTPGLSSTAGFLGIPTGNGLPLLGKAYVRANAGGVLAAGGLAGFGGSWEHRYTRPVTP